jgi:hypothetical protein
MLSQWIKSRRMFVAVGIAVVSWATLQNEGVASSEFLTDRIGEGSIMRISQTLDYKGTQYDGHVLYFQEGRPTPLTQISAEKPFCRFESTGLKFSERFKKSPELVVKFKNVARARWFFENGVELECVNPADHKVVHESDFNQALGHSFNVEKHRTAHHDDAI